MPGTIDESPADQSEILPQMQWEEGYFLRQTQAIDYERLSCEPVSRAMLGMMGLAGRHPYPRDELRRMWREDAAGRTVDEKLLLQFLHFVLATSALSQEELLELALETGLLNQEVKMNVIIQPLIRDAFRKGNDRGGVRKRGVRRGVWRGVRRGDSEGRLEGMSALLLSLVRERFGPVPEGHRAEAEICHACRSGRVGQIAPPCAEPRRCLRERCQGPGKAITPKAERQQNAESAGRNSGSVGTKPRTAGTQCVPIVPNMFGRSSCPERKRST